MFKVFEHNALIEPHAPKRKTFAGVQTAVETLARVFHTDRDEEAAKSDGVRQTSILTFPLLRE
jgi:hypothetical protein